MACLSEDLSSLSGKKILENTVKEDPVRWQILPLTSPVIEDLERFENSCLEFKPAADRQAPLSPTAEFTAPACCSTSILTIIWENNRENVK